MERFTVADLSSELSRQIMVPGHVPGTARRAAVVVSRIRSFAKDIDTHQELAEVLR